MLFYFFHSASTIYERHLFEITLPSPSLNSIVAWVGCDVTLTKVTMHPYGGTPVCARCSKVVYAAEQVRGHSVLIQSASNQKLGDGSREEGQ